MRKTVYYLAVLFLFSSCILDTSEVKLEREKTLTASFGVPVAGGTFKLSSILPDTTKDGVLAINEKGEYYIKPKDIEGMKISYERAAQLFTFSGIENPPSLRIDLPLSGPPLPIKSDYAIDPMTTAPITLWSGTDAGVNPKAVTLSQAEENKIILSISPAVDDYTIKVTMGTVEQTERITNNRQLDFELDLRGKTLDLEDLKISVGITVHAKANIASPSFEIYFSIGKLDFQAVHGTFSGFKVPVGEFGGKSFPIETPDFGDFQDLLDKTAITDIKFGMDYTSNLGVGTDIALKVSQVTKGVSAPTELASTTLRIPAAATLDEEKKGGNEVAIPSLGLNIDSVKIGDADIKLSNKEGFIGFPFKLEIQPVFNLPLNLQMDNVTYSFFSALDLKNLDINQAQLIFDYKNELALNIGLTAYLIKGGNRMDSVKVTNQDDKQANLLTMGKGQVFVSMEKAFALKITQADSMEFALKVRTDDADGNLKSLKISNKATFDINVRAAGEIKYKLGGDDK